MTRDEFLSQITQIGTCEDETERRSMLNALRDETTALFDTVDNLTTQNNTLSENNESLRKANMELFVQAGSSRSPIDTTDPTPEPQKRSFDNLFNEKGDLK